MKSLPLAGTCALGMLHILTKISGFAVVSMAVQTKVQVSGHGTGQVLAKKAFQKCKSEMQPLQTEGLS